jgi:membrane protein
MNYAAALAYNAVFSLFPLLLLSISILAFFYSTPDAQAQVINSVSDFLPGVSSLVSSVVHEAVAARGPVTIIGIVTLTWAASNAFSALETAIGLMWNTQGQRGFLGNRLVAFALLVAAAVLMFAALAVSSILNLVQSNTTVLLGFVPYVSVFWLVVQNVVNLALVFVVFTLLYRFLPRTTVSFAEVWAGALLAAVLWVVAKIAFSLYLGSFANFNATYGSIGAVFALITWLDFSAIMLLFGAEFASEWAQERRMIAVSASVAAPTPEMERPWHRRTAAGTAGKRYAWAFVAASIGAAAAYAINWVLGFGRGPRSGRV